ncbi:unnamed protein product [Rhizopus stolonifer]
MYYVYKNLEKRRIHQKLHRTENMDFSVMMSERKRNAYLFLGPARFINHDCDPNCVFVQQASNVTFRALKVIKLGDELTVSYGDHYFGIDNCECRCLTCEKNERGFYLKKVEEKLEKVSTLSRKLRKRKDIQYAEIKSKRKNSFSSASAASVSAASVSAASVSAASVSAASVSAASVSAASVSAASVSAASVSVASVSVASVSVTSTTSISTSTSTSTCTSVASDAHDVSATSDVSDACALSSVPSSIKTTMSIANICNLSNVTPKLSAFGFKEAFEPTARVYPEDTSVFAQENPAPLKCCPWASTYTKSTDDDKCVRCFRHFKIFNLVWPQRKH